MERKREFRWFTIWDYEKEQEYLRQRHKEGWKFVKVTGFGIYHFEKCQPEDVVYQLDYNQEGLAHKDEYVQMFADCGWEYMMDYAGYSYFRKPAAAMHGDEQIFCDDDSRIQMMERVYKGRMLPLLVLFFCLLLPQFILNLTVYNNYLLAAVLGGILGLYVGIFLHAAYKFGKYKQQ